MDKAAVPLFIQKTARRAPTFADLAEMAIAELQKSGGRAEVVCGPITTGGSGNTVTNLLLFNYAIELLQDAGRPIFSQMPYEAGLADLEHAWKENNTGTYCHPILEEFYTRVFSPTLIRRGWFLPDWESSYGARWEYAHLTKLKIDIRVLDPNWMFGLQLPKDLD